MLARFASGIALVASLLYPASPVAADVVAPATAWSERGVFVFGHILLDFKFRIESLGLGPHTRLIDCSTLQFYCAYAGVLHLALPRECRALEDGDSWSVNGVTTYVLYKGADPAATRGYHPYGSGTIMLLGDPKFSDVVYDYDPESGVTGIYYVPNTDIVSIARKGQDGLQMFHESGQYNPLFTLDLFGRCRR
jgi:hypothetical protein